jgi:hypothetical protein
MTARPLTLKQANAAIAEWHRHHKPVQGHRFSIGAYDGDTLCGVCVVGRPVARGCDPYGVAEVTRLATNGAGNACSFLYGRAARAAQAMGFARIQTYILAEEPGTSLRAAGWVLDGHTKGGDWNNGPYAGRRRTDQPQGPKLRYGRDFDPSK